MFTIFVAEKDNKRIEFEFNDNAALWFRVIDQRNNSFVGGKMLGYLPDDVNALFGGSVDRFFNEEVIPECNAILKKVFGSGGGEHPEPTDMIGIIEQRLRALVFDSSKNELR